MTISISILWLLWALALVACFGLFSCGFFSRQGNMRKLILFLSFQPFLLFAEVRCEMEQMSVDNDGSSGIMEYVVTCYWDGLEHVTNDVYISTSECERLRDGVTSNVNACVSTMNRVENFLYVVSGDCSEMISQVDDIIAENVVAPSSVSQTNINYYANDLKANLQSLKANADDYSFMMFQINSDLNQLLSDVSDVDCSSPQSCNPDSGGSSVVCPCQVEFNSLLQELRKISGSVVEIRDFCISNNLQLVAIKSRLDVLIDGFSNVVERLNSPDDRMWGELTGIYTALSSNLHQVVYSSLDIPLLLDEVHHLVRDGAGSDDPENDRLKLTTEGVISLYNSVFGMARTLQDQYNYRAFDSTVRYFSNTITRLFQDYNSITIRTLSPPADNRYLFIYRAATNFNLNARQRYTLLANTINAGVTNWFQRMELYQQAHLGWFDNFSTGEYGQQQDSLTESSIDWSLYNTTNDLGLVSSASSNVFLSVEKAASSIIKELQTVQIQASLPTLVTLFPEFEISKDIGTIPAITFDTTDVSDLCLFARKITSLLWRASFWVLYVGLAVGVSRIVFILVLFVVNLAKSL